MQAIVYTSNTGSTERYAQMMGEATGLPVYSLKEAQTALPAGAPIFYMGWVMASGIKGYKKAAKTYKICAVAAVGMATTGQGGEALRERNALPEEFPLFPLQGGLQPKKLHGIYKFIINKVSQSGAKALLQKADRTPEDDKILQLLLKGGDCVCEENLADALAWYRSQN